MGMIKKKNAARRYPLSKTSVGRSIELADDDVSIVNGQTRYPDLVRTPSVNENVLKSGVHSRKLGSHVTAGKWKGFPIFGLTLEERATCPRSCQQWKICYGNGMGQMRSYRYKHGSALIEQLEVELNLYNSEPRTRTGFAVRLHTLGDFYSVDYVNKWSDWLDKYPSLHVFGFTAREPHTEIGAAIKKLRDDHWARFAIRFSNSSEPYRSSMVIKDHAEYNLKDGIVCPAEIGKKGCCGECGLCWSTDRRIVFLEH